jgi:photosystem II stability/assembly factor-like uncharacterized protein
MFRAHLALVGAAAAATVSAQTTTQDVRAHGSVIARMPHSGPGLAAQRSQPGGETDSAWQLVTVPAGVYLRAISMGSSSVGFAAAEQGVVLRSTNGGDSWQVILNDGFPFYYYGVHAFSAQTVLITGFNNTANTGVFRWSDDGGNTWGPVQTLAPGTPIQWLYFVNFADAQHGVIQCAIGTHHTSTGGRTPADWTFNEPTNNWFLGPFTFLPDLRVWMTGYDNFRSIDGGATWTPLPRANSLFDGPSAFTASDRGFIGGGSISPTVAGWLYSSANGGSSWSSQPILQPPYPIRAILMLDDQRAWAVGGNYYSNVGGIWGTTDGGQHWSLEQNTGAELLDIQRVGNGPAEVDIYAAGEISQIWRLRVSTTCYANCDGSTAPPVLNIGDFVCFQARFAAGDSYANCDGSTIPPVLNVNDFVCFQQAFAAGCP